MLSEQNKKESCSVTIIHPMVGSVTAMFGHKFKFCQTTEEPPSNGWIDSIKKHTLTQVSVPLSESNIWGSIIGQGVWTLTLVVCCSNNICPVVVKLAVKILLQIFLHAAGAPIALASDHWSLSLYPLVSKLLVPFNCRHLLYHPKGSPIFPIHWGSI